MTVQTVQLIYKTVPIQDTDLHNLRNPQDYLRGTSWKTEKLEAHLQKYETEDCENDEILE